MQPSHAIASAAGASEPTTYAVPQRFGIAALLGMTTLFACLFAALRAMNAPPVLYLFFGSVGSVIGLAQMKLGDSPRAASATAGAVLLPIWIVIPRLVTDERLPGGLGGFVALLPCSIVGGGIFGYLTGAILAGVFLLLDIARDPDKAKAMWRERHRPRRDPPKRAQWLMGVGDSPVRAGLRSAVVQARDVVCGACRFTSRQSLLVASPVSPIADLDLRPAEPQRSSLTLAIQCCPACGCCAGDILQPRFGASKCSSSTEYQALLRDEGYPEVARRFLCASLIEASANDFANSAGRRIQAAWICDDENNEIAAAKCRRLAAEQIHRAVAANQPVAGGPAADYALLADLYRRAGDHVQALAACSKADAMLCSFDADLSLKQVVDFQRARALAHDARLYTIAETTHAAP